MMHRSAKSFMTYLLKSLLEGVCRFPSSKQRPPFGPYYFLGHFVWKTAQEMVAVKNCG